MSKSRLEALAWLLIYVGLLGLSLGWILHQHHAAVAANSGGPRRAVTVGPGEHDTDQARPIDKGRRLEKHIHRRP